MCGTCAFLTWSHARWDRSRCWRAEHNCSTRGDCRPCPRKGLCLGTKLRSDPGSVGGRRQFAVFERGKVRSWAMAADSFALNPSRCCCRPRQCRTAVVFNRPNRPLPAEAEGARLGRLSWSTIVHRCQVHHRRRVNGKGTADVHRAQLDLPAKTMGDLVAFHNLHEPALSLALLKSLAASSMQASCLVATHRPPRMC